MCVTPRLIFKRSEDNAAFRPYAVACRACWQCKSNRIWDWVGRAIAERETSRKAYFVTLTYGNTNRLGEVLTERAKSLHYKDVQRWLYRIRKKHRVRYIVTGEYGPKTGRAHWHAILFFKDAGPDVKVGFRYWNTSDVTMDPFWKDGNTRWEEFAPEHVRYVCKYMLKAGEGNDSYERHAMLSKKPPLGHEYFMQRAEKYVEQGLSPQDLIYHFPEVKFGKKNPKPRSYVLQGVSADNFLSHYVETWRLKYGCDSWPYSEVVSDYLHSEMEDAHQNEQYLTRERQPKKEGHSLEMPWYVPDQEQSFPTVEPCKLYVDRRYNLWAISDPSMPDRAPRYWSFDENGFSGWHDVPNLVTEATATRLREVYVSLQNPPEVSFERKAARGRQSGK